MDAQTIKEWLIALAPYAAVLVSLMTYARLQRKVDGRMDELERSWQARAHAMVAAARAEALEPDRVAAARALVKSDAADAKATDDAR
jgi:hypothetical protein